MKFNLFKDIQVEKLFKAIPFTHVCLAIHGEEKAKEYCRDDKFDWQTETINVMCWAGLMAFTVWGANGMNNFSDIILGLKAGFLAGGFAFFGIFATKKGLYKKYNK